MSSRNQKRVFLMSMIMVWVIVIHILIGPSSVDIRLDTGDLRYRYFGIPFYYDRMPEPRRSQLLALANNNRSIMGDWHCCADYPLPTTNNPHLMCRQFYLQLAAWIEYDRDIASHMANDIARYIRETNASSGLPRCYSLLMSAKLDTDGEYKLPDNWRSPDYIKKYLEYGGGKIFLDDISTKRPE